MPVSRSRRFAQSWPYCVNRWSKHSHCSSTRCWKAPKGVADAFPVWLALRGRRQTCGGRWSRGQAWQNRLHQPSERLSTQYRSLRCAQRIRAPTGHWACSPSARRRWPLPSLLLLVNPGEHQLHQWHLGVWQGFWTGSIHMSSAALILQDRKTRVTTTKGTLVSANLAAACLPALPEHSCARTPLRPPCHENTHRPDTRSSPT